VGGAPWRSHPVSDREVGRTLSTASASLAYRERTALTGLRSYEHCVVEPVWVHFSRWLSSLSLVCLVATGRRRVDGCRRKFAIFTNPQASPERRM
jgi:hypothetical protein